MTNTIWQLKKLPFKEDLGLPQRIRFEHKNELYRLRYRRNSFDQKIHIKIELVKTGETLLTTRLVEGAIHYITKKENKGVLDFLIYVDKIGTNNMEILVLDEDTRFRKEKEL